MCFLGCYKSLIPTQKPPISKVTKYIIAYDTRIRYEDVAVVAYRFRDQSVFLTLCERRMATMPHVYIYSVKRI